MNKNKPHINFGEIKKDDFNKPKKEQIKSKVEDCNKSPKEIIEEIKSKK